jgi:hypothetical protein
MLGPSVGHIFSLDRPDAIVRACEPARHYKDTTLPATGARRMNRKSHQK